MENNRKNDSKVEREVAAFLDKNLYSNKEIFSEFVRTDDKDSQIKGSDVILSTSDGIIYRRVIDEKVAIRYANTGLNTFALELSFINKAGKRTCGWFTDSAKSTEYYLLGWITKAEIPYDEKKKRWSCYEITRDNIKELEWVLVSRQKIMNFLEKKGWSLERLGRQDEKIRKAGKVATNDFIDEIAFRYSPDYIEKPINILLKKDSFFSMSSYKGKISL